MKKRSTGLFIIGAIALLIFVVWTALVCFVDVKQIGPNNTSVGFSTLNEYVHSLTSENMLLYEITDWLGLVPIIVALSFATLGVIQWIKRKSLVKVDKSLFVLGGFYIVVMALFIFFEIVIINYRPVLINGCLEASYPSSTTLLVMCVMPTAIMQLNAYIKNTVFKRITAFVMIAFTAFMVIGRLISGVHWISDIIGGALLSFGLVTVYYATVLAISNSQEG
jgi:undecaprenyl-diphosphatase